MQLRDSQTRPQSTALAKSAHALAAKIDGAPARGADPAADYARDREQIDALNRRLAEKKCKTVDIDAELKGEPPAAAPATPKSK